MAGTEVRFLGSGDAFCADGRHHSAYLVTTEGSSLMLDCGATALSSLKLQKIDPATVDVVILSHLHGDHFAGLPFLLLDYSFETKRKNPLRIMGPPGTEERVWQLCAATYRELVAKPLPFAVAFQELAPDNPVQSGTVTITPFRVPHQEKDLSFAIFIDTGRHRILYSGDTGWTEDLVMHAQGTDLFICECSFFESRFPFHLDYRRLIENRERFGTSRLILTHLGSELLAHVDEVDIELATDGMRIELT